VGPVAEEELDDDDNDDDDHDDDEYDIEYYNADNANGKVETIEDVDLEVEVEVGSYSDHDSNCATTVIESSSAAAACSVTANGERGVKDKDKDEEKEWTQCWSWIKEAQSLKAIEDSTASGPSRFATTDTNTTTIPTLAVEDLSHSHRYCADMIGADDDGGDVKETLDSSTIAKKNDDDCGVHSPSSNHHQAENCVRPPVQPFSDEEVLLPSPSTPTTPTEGEDGGGDKQTASSHTVPNIVVASQSAASASSSPSLSSLSSLSLPSHLSSPLLSKLSSSPLRMHLIETVLSLPKAITFSTRDDSPRHR
jgi:hypothetical protein